mgnify:FL=1
MESVYSTGKFPDVSCIFQALGHAVKVRFDDYQNGIFVYSVGVLVFKIWIELFLAHLSGDGFYHNAGRLPFLPPVCEKDDAKDYYGIEKCDF